MATNTTLVFDLPPLPSYTIRPLPPLIPGIADKYTTLALPIIAYWIFSLIFHLLDVWDLFPQYRLHTPAEVLKRNHVSRWDVLRDVVFQQVVQTVVGLVGASLDDDPVCGKEMYDITRWARGIRLAQGAIPTILATVGLDAKSMAGQLGTSHAMLAGALSGGLYPQFTQTVEVLGEQVAAPAFAPWELFAAKAIYHIAVPAVQFFVAILIVDTWQYFLHRAMHMNKYLYTTFHSRHHRLYVPYAYGALYNHPFEGFLLDTVGTFFAYVVSGMTVRQSMWFFTMATIKTVDDHCGYKFPWDPLQRITSNNAAYHDVHHQSWGIKTNFSQPFFTFWDSLLGTKWTGGDVSARYARAKAAAQLRMDADAGAHSKPYQSEATDASSTARAIQAVAEPTVPSGKARLQALGSRQQILDDDANGGVSIIAEESAEEVRAQQSVRRSPRKRTPSLGLKGFAGRVGDSLHGKGTGILGVESGR